MSAKLGCNRCEQLCVEKSFPNGDEFAMWAMEHGDILTEVFLDRPEDRAHILLVVKCGQCGQQFMAVVGESRSTWGTWKPVIRPSDAR